MFAIFGFKYFFQLKVTKFVTCSMFKRGTVHRGQTAVGAQICLGHSFSSSSGYFSFHVWFCFAFSLGWFSCLLWLIYGQ